jgi:hypothetical protein
MQVVDVLSDKQKVSLPIAFESREREVSGVWLNARLVKLPPSLVVKLLHETRVSLKTLGRGDVFDAMIFPESVRVPKGFDA